jgi:hypothetical protein
MLKGLFLLGASIAMPRNRKRYRLQPERESPDANSSAHRPCPITRRSQEKIRNVSYR